MRATEVLIEFNVTNLDKVDSYIASVATKLADKSMLEWFKVRARKYIINAEEVNHQITTLSSDPPEWMVKRHQEGVPLYLFTPNSSLSTKMNHVVDWMNALSNAANGQGNGAKNAQKSIKKINNMSFQQAIEAADRWTEHENSKVADDIDDSNEIEPIITYDDGSKWVKLLGADALRREGKLMGHCVGGYHDKVASGHTQIYSFRNPKNGPHVTIEINNKKLEQVKGKQNRAPVSKYVAPTVELLNKLNVPPTSQGRYDLDNAEIYFEDGKYGDIYDISEVVFKNKVGEMIKTPKASYGTEYMVWAKGRSWAKLNIRHDGVNIVDIDDKARMQIGPFIAEFLNSLDKIPTPKSPGDLAKSGIVYDHTITEYKKIDDYKDNVVKTYDDGTQVIEVPELISSYNRGGRSFYFMQDGQSMVRISVDENEEIQHIKTFKRFNKDKSDERKAWEEEYKEKLLSFMDGYSHSQGSFDYGEKEVKHNRETKKYSNDYRDIYEPMDQAGDLSVYEVDGNNGRMLVIYEGDEILGEFGRNATFKTPFNDHQKAFLVKAMNDTEIDVKELWGHDTATYEKNGIFRDLNNNRYTSDIEDTIRQTVDGVDIYELTHTINFAVNRKTFLVANKSSKDVGKYSYRSVKSISKIKSKNKLAAVKYNGVIAEFFTSGNYVKDFSRGGESSELAKELGISYSGGKWKAKKIKQTEIFNYEGNSFVKNGNVVGVTSPDGDVVGDLVMSSGKTIKEINGDIKTLAPMVVELCNQHDYELDITNGEIVNKLHEAGYMSERRSHGDDIGWRERLEPIEERFPSENIAKFDGMTWKKIAWDRTFDSDVEVFNDYDRGKTIKKYKLTRPRENSYTLMDADGMSLLRVYCDNKNEIKKIKIAGGEVTTETLSEHLTPLSVLFKKAKIDVNGRWLASYDLIWDGNKVLPISENPKLKQFTDGRITYEDGHFWVRGDVEWQHGDKNKWTLKLNYEDDGGTTRTTDIATIEVDDDGIKNISFKTSKIRKKPKLYRPQLNDMMDIIDDLSGDFNDN